MPDTTIIAELSQISSLLAGSPASTPYQLPTGYFQTLADDILYRITVVETAENDPLLNINKQTPFRVPEQYFDKIASTILDRIHAAEARTSQEEINILSPLLSGISKQMPFSIPDHYFEHLSLPVTADMEAEQVPSFLQSARTNATYQLPAGYFDRVAATVLEKVHQAAPEAKVIPMNFSRKVIRYAAAASIAAIIAVSGWFMFRQQPAASTGKSLASIQNASSQELQDFLDKNTFALPESNTTSSQDIKPEDVKTMLAGVPDEELQQYLEQQPNLKDPASNNYN